MDGSTTPKHSRIEQCRKNAREKSEKKRQAAFEALSAIQREKRPVTKAAIARRAGVSVVFLRSHLDLLQSIEAAENARPVLPLAAIPGDQAKDQVISALRRRLGELKQALAAKDAELHQKQREVDRLYGKLAAASPLTDPELRRALADALERLEREEHAIS